MMAQAAIKDNEELNEPTSQYISLSLGNVNLLAQQSNITTIESIHKIDSINTLTGSIGWIHYNNHKIPVYNINGQLEVVNSMPGDKMICAVLNSGDIYISIACQEVSAFKHQLVKFERLPECMQTAQCPIESLCFYTNDGKTIIDFIIDSESFVNYIRNYNHS